MITNKTLPAIKQGLATRSFSAGAVRHKELMTNSEAFVETLVSRGVTDTFGIVVIFLKLIPALLLEHPGAGICLYGLA
jgi:hypothetical protein